MTEVGIGRIALAGLGASALIAQAAWFASSAFMVLDIASLPDTVFAGRVFTVEEITPYIRDTVASYSLGAGVGVTGALIAWLLMLKGRFDASWFLLGNRVLGWLWMPFIPVGTAVGVLLLSARAQLLNPAADEYD